MHITKITDSNNEFTLKNRTSTRKIFFLLERFEVYFCNSYYTKNFIY